MEKINFKPIKKNNNLHSEIHYLVDLARKRFGETAKKGKGSFGFYLGFFKKLDPQTIYRFLAEVKSQNNPKRLFWWKIGRELKKK